jgi:hypothetical protein
VVVKANTHVIFFSKGSQKYGTNNAVEQFVKNSDFEQWIQNLQETKALRNDDVTLLRIITQEEI